MTRFACLLSLGLLSCQPAPSAEADIDAQGKPIIRLTAEEAAACARSGVCLLLTEQQFELARAAAYRAGHKAAQRERNQCGRDA